MLCLKKTDSIIAMIGTSYKKINFGTPLSAQGSAASEYHELVSVGGHVPPERQKQKTGSLLRIKQ
jgi:hypothetical protein